MASIQCMLRENMAAHKYGFSIANQRVESWWSSMRRSYTGWLIDFFKGKIAEDRFVTGNHLHKEIALFSFSNMLQRDLSELRMLWNTH